jgi:hypothetical protein
MGSGGAISVMRFYRLPSKYMAWLKTISLLVGFLNDYGLDVKFPWLLGKYLKHSLFPGD